jgi:hypothetical protein
MAGRKRKLGQFWAWALAFSGGYLVTSLLLKTAAARAIPGYAAAIMVAITLVPASRSGSPLKGAVRGLIIGVVGAVGMAVGMVRPDVKAPAEAIVRAGLVAACANCACTVIAGALFGYLAQRRNRRMYG